MTTTDQGKHDQWCNRGTKVVGVINYGMIACNNNEVGGEIHISTANFAKNPQLERS